MECFQRLFRRCEQVIIFIEKSIKYMGMVLFFGSHFTEYVNFGLQ